MISYPNQKSYIISKKIEEGDIFIMLKWDDYCAAAGELSPSALKLYMYLAKNKDGYEFYFSSKDFCDTFKVVDKTYRNARNELINKGYLKECEGNRVHFSSCAAFKKTTENLKEELTRLGGIIKAENLDMYTDFCDKILEEKLSTIKDDSLYRYKIEKLISFAEELIKEFARNDIEKML